MNPFRSAADRQPPLGKSRRFSKAPASQPRRGQRLELEALEDRFLPAGAIISGFVFNDLNNNGLMETGEPPIANSTIELRNAQNVVVGTATTDANGHYQFDHDATVSTAVQTITKTFTIPATATNFSLAGAIDKFDPALGNLIEVDVVNAGAITSDIRVENTSTSSPSTIQATVAGHLTLTGPGGLTVETDLSQNAGSFGASIYDGHLDFGGTSGKDFGNSAANGTESLVLTGAAMNVFVGTGTIALTETAEASSTASGGGNLLVGVTSTASAQVTVTYKYIADNSLKPGNYTLIQTTEPPGFFDGKESRNGVVLPNPPGTDIIPLTVASWSNW